MILTDLQGIWKGQVLFEHKNDFNKYYLVWDVA